MPSATRPNARAMDSSTSTRQATKAATTPRAPASPTRWTSSISSLLARSISYLISWDTSLAARATRSPSDWPSPAGSGVFAADHPVHLPRVRTTIRAPARLCGARVRLLLGARSCSAKSKASVVVPERSAPRTRAAFQAPCGRNPGAGTGPRRAYRPGGRPGTPGPIGGPRILRHLHPCVGIRRIATSQSHPDARAETCRPEEQTENRRMWWPRKCERRPWPGRRCKTTSSLATKRAPSLSARPAATGPAWLDTPPAAGRAWVPGCRARTSERP